MNTINRISTVILFFLIISSCNKSKNNNLFEIPVININHNDLKEKVDVSSIVDTSFFQFINLETNDECLIGGIGKIAIRDDKIIIYDELAKKVFIFNPDGSFYSKIAAIGQGPHEYPPIVNDCVIGKKTVGMFVPAIGKIKLYNFEGEFIEDISLRDCWGRTYFTFDEQNYFIINDWSETEHGLFRFFSFNQRERGINKYLPFNLQKNENRGWGLNNYYSIYNNNALIIYSTIDIIFNVSNINMDIEPAFRVHFKNNKLPDKILSGDGRKALMLSLEEDKTTGMSNIAETSNYIILTTSKNSLLFYNKKEGKEEFFTQMLTIPSWGNISFGLSSSSFIQDDKIINVFEPPIILGMMKDWLDKTDFSNKSFKSDLRKSIDKINNEMDNPVIFLMRFKNETNS